MSNVIFLADARSRFDRQLDAQVERVGDMLGRLSDCLVQTSAIIKQCPDGEHKDALKAHFVAVASLVLISRAKVARLSS